MALSSRSFLLILLVALILFTTRAHAFGAGNIASISSIEGKNWRHGDIEDLLKQVTCIKHHKWSSMMIKRVYFGNWLRDYSQAMDTGALKKAQPETIRILVWLLSFLGFGYATAEFEVTSERLGVYRPEEHIDNPKNYNDDQDARPYDARLRGPVRPIELEIDQQTGMKNYIANSKGDWATSAAFVKYSFIRSIHHGRQYTSESGTFSRGEDDDLAEALRLLGQGLHTLEDFGAHTNYVELALIEMGHRDVFAQVGRDTAIDVRGKRIFPLVTGTFGMVDFYHSVLGEATDHFAQSEVNEMDNAMGVAEQAAQSSSPLLTLGKLLAKVPGTGGLISEAQSLQAFSQAQAQRNRDLGATRGLDSTGVDYNSARGFEDVGSTRDPGGFPGASSQGAQSHDWNNTSQGWQNQNYNNYNQQPGYAQQNYNNYGQQPPPPSQQSWNQSTPQSWNAPQPQWQSGSSYHQDFGTHGTQQGPSYSDNQYNSHQSQPSYSQPPNPQSYQQPAQNSQTYGNPSDHYPQQSQPSWQQPPQPQTSVPSNPLQTVIPGVQPTPATPLQNPGPPGKIQGLEGMPDFDPAKFIKQIYPILAFRDKVVRSVSAIIEKIPGLEALVERIVETLTVFIFSLLAPFVKPVLNALQKTLQSSSEGVTEWNKKHQYEVWEDPRCSDPTHSMLSKDHFSNMLNEPAGNVAGAILKFIAPRILYAWEHPEVPVDRVMQDVDSIFHHPAFRDEGGNECHRNMFAAVRKWVDSRDDRGRGLEAVLNAQAVREGKNHKAGVNDHAGHGSNMSAQGPGYGAQAQGAWSQAQHLAGLVTGNQHHNQPHQPSQGGIGGMLHQVESFIPGGRPSHGSGGFLQQAESLLGVGGKQSHGGGGSFDMLSLANNIPGVGKYTNSLQQFNKISNLMGGGRELPGEGPDSFETNARGINDDGDYGDSDFYRSLGIASIGGGEELYESAIRGSQSAMQTSRGGMDQAMTPDDGPIPTPSGYEQYKQGGDYIASGSSGYQAQTGNYGQQQSYGGYGGYQQQPQPYSGGQHPPRSDDTGYGGQRFGGAGGYDQGYAR